MLWKNSAERSVARAMAEKKIRDYRSMLFDLCRRDPEYERKVDRLHELINEWLDRWEETHE